MGFEYLMGSVALGDGGMPVSTPMTRYYLESGTPAGVFLGRGLAGLDGGNGVAVGTLVSEQALWRLLGLLVDPVTGEPLGRRPQQAPVGAGSQPVAGFDLTFSAPKSVSVWWALADANTQRVIHQAHRDAIALAIGWAEDTTVFTRTGAGGRTQQPVNGLICAAFDHWDSRTGDPHLHTHVVVANRVQTPDGTWRTVDGAALFRYTVALSELHEGLLHDLLTERLGVTWTARTRAHSSVPRWDLDGVPVALVDAFSSRSAAISEASSELIGEFVARRGRHPSNVELLKLRQQATLETRPDKHQVPLAQRMAGWRNQAGATLGRDASDTVAAVANRAAETDVAPIRAGRVDAGMLDALGRQVLAAVGQKRAVFGAANVLAETHRQLHALVFATGADRLTVAARVTDAALAAALPIDTDPGRALHAGAARYTTTEVLDAETRLLDTARTLTGPAIDTDMISDAVTPLGPDQAAAVTAIATSGRGLDVLVGPAGTGKTTSLAGLKNAWESVFGTGSVTGLAPSAAAAQVLADELGIAADNTAKWLVEQDRIPQRQAEIARLDAEREACRGNGSILARRLIHQIHDQQTELDRWAPRAGQLVIIDEATLAGTLALDRIVASAHEAGAKVLLVGDWAQLGALEAGGAFHLLATDRPDTPTLHTVRRFHDQWEVDASLHLRDGDPAALDAYLDHDRIRSGDRAAMLHAVFDAWAADTDTGLTSAMIAADDTTVAELNALAQAHQHDTRATAAGVNTPSDSPAFPLADGHSAALGDRIRTRRNDRRLPTGDGGWVKNGDTWTITAIHPDRSITAANDDRGRTVRLPADYISEHAELGYASTIHRAQGATLDTAHALLDKQTTREALYVAATRGRARNNVYLDTSSDSSTDNNDLPEPTTERDARSLLAAALARSAATASAHAAIADAADRRREEEAARATWTHHWTPPTPTNSIELS